MGDVFTPKPIGWRRDEGLKECQGTPEYAQTTVVFLGLLVVGEAGEGR